MNRVASGLVSAFFAMAIAACSASGNSATLDDGGTDAAVLGECPPPTALMPINGSKDVWSNAAVPRGSCAGTISCQILIDPCCHPVTGADPVDHYTCRCADDAWHCD
ncbi:MAG: hypothetical protein ABI183_11940, partial [Polyangiaceae bacterium]